MIAIDGVPAAKENKTGVEWYVYHLLKEMHALRPDLDVTVYSHRPIDIEFTGGWKNKVLNWPFKGWSKIRWSATLLKEQPDILFVPGDEIPSILPGRVITTIHDLGFKEVPELYSRKNRNRQERAHRRAADRAECIAITEKTKQDFIKYYNKNPEKIHKIHLGYNRHLFHKRDQEDKEMQDLLKARKIEQPFFYFVSRVEKRKGADTLIAAYKKYRQNGGKANLVIAGPVVDESIRASAKQTQSIKFMGHVTERENALLMSAAEKFVFPTKKEGFGIPIIEALACGTPVLTSNLEVLKEVGGQAPTYIDQNNTTEWANQMAKDHTSKIEEGIEQAKKYSWKKTAQKTIDLILKTDK